MSEWKFRRRQGWCSACESRFADGDRYVSVLSIEGEDLSREDRCLACWNDGKNSAPLFFWYTRHHANRRGLQLDLATLEQLFLQLEGRTEAQVRELRYVLCLLLMRKRRLKLDRVLRGSADDGESMLVHRPRRKESLRVFVFDFAPERMEVLRADLVRLLEGAEPAQSDGGREGIADAEDAAGEDDASPADGDLVQAATGAPPGSR
jgi:hypothetical protein